MRTNKKKISKIKKSLKLLSTLRPEARGKVLANCSNNVLSDFKYFSKCVCKNKKVLNSRGFRKKFRKLLPFKDTFRKIADSKSLKSVKKILLKESPKTVGSGIFTLLASTLIPIIVGALAK